MALPPGLRSVRRSCWPLLSRQQPAEVPAWEWRGWEAAALLTDEAAAASSDEEEEAKTAPQFAVDEAFEEEEEMAFE